MLASIIIGNYNYGQYLGDAIESALRQSYANREVIVVDDGSTDRSHEVIEAFAHVIRPIFAEHRGQCACLNTGFAASRGDVVLFLDSDDSLHADALVNLMRPMRDDDRVVQSQGYLEVVDKARRKLGRRVPRRLPPSGDYRKRTLKRGFGACQHPYTSGSLWRRRFLERVFPLPELISVLQHKVYVGPDGYLNGVAQLFGRLVSVPSVVADYRVHGQNIWHGATRFNAEALRAHLATISHHTDYLLRWSTALGYAPDGAEWRKWKGSWADNLAEFALSRLDASESAPRFDALVLAPFKAGATHPVKAVGLAAVLAAVWCAPKSAALNWSKRLLERKLPHLSNPRLSATSPPRGE